MRNGYLSDIEAKIESGTINSTINGTINVTAKYILELLDKKILLP